MRHCLALLAYLCFSVAVHAAPASDASIEKLLAAMQAEKLVDSVLGNFDASMKQTTAQMLQGQEVTPEMQQHIDRMSAKVAQMMREEMTWEKMRPLYIDIYRDSYTQEEIDGLTAFYESPTGRSFVAKTPEVMQRSMSAMQTRLVPMMEKMRTIMEETATEISAGKDGARKDSEKKKSGKRRS